jgi:hypothetical protein
MPIPKFWPMEGSAVAANFEFLDDTGEPADPTEVQFFVKAPGETAVAVVAENLGTGLYRAEFLVDAPGTWVVQAKGTGAVVVTDEVQFDVRDAVIDAI